MEHLFAVEQVRAGLAQITQVYLRGGDGKKNTEQLNVCLTLIFANVELSSGLACISLSSLGR